MNVLGGRGRFSKIPAMNMGDGQGGRSCASAQAALDEKFGLGRKF